MRDVPAVIQTTCELLNTAWQTHIAALIGAQGIVVADNDEEMNWDLFLSRSAVLGSRRGLAAGKDSDAPNLAQLREHGITLAQLAALWEIEPLRQHLLHKVEKPEDEAAQSCLQLLRKGGKVGELLCDAFQSQPKSSSHWSVRALLENSAALESCDYSFRKWLESECHSLGETKFPPPDFRRMVIMTDHNGVAQRTLEQALPLVMGRVFHQASAPVAAHMLCDWQLGLWLDEKTSVFDLFPNDGIHREFVDTCDDLPEGDTDFAAWWHEQPECSLLPPRLATACMARAVYSGDRA